MTWFDVEWCLSTLNRIGHGNNDIRSRNEKNIDVFLVFVNWQQRQQTWCLKRIISLQDCQGGRQSYSMILMIYFGCNQRLLLLLITFENSGKAFKFRDFSACFLSFLRSLRLKNICLVKEKTRIRPEIPSLL